MPKTDTRPWAFDDCPPWKEFVEKTQAAGLRLRCIDEWKSPDINYRGSNVRQYVILYGPPGGGQLQYITTAIVIAHAQEGFNLYLQDERLEMEPTIAQLVARGQEKEARNG